MSDNVSQAYGDKVYVCPVCGFKRVTDGDPVPNHEHPEVGEPFIAFVPEDELEPIVPIRRRRRAQVSAED